MWKPADFPLLTMESTTIACCLNATTVIVGQLPPVCIPAGLLLPTNTGVFSVTCPSNSTFIARFCQISFLTFILNQGRADTRSLKM